MNELNMPAFPYSWDESVRNSAQGLTKREYFAGLAMQGLRACAHPQAPTTSDEIADLAVADADALIAELERTK